MFKTIRVRYVGKTGISIRKLERVYVYNLVCGEQMADQTSRYAR
jgi:hypothetical protein